MPPINKQPPFELSLVIESPPLVLYGDPKDSPGSILSGLLNLKVNDPKGIDLTSVRLQLVQEIKTKRSVVASCENCRCRRTVIKSWDLIGSRSNIRVGRHEYPFSTLIAGNTPATCNVALCSISYILEAVVVPASSAHSPLRFAREVTIGRAMIGGTTRTARRVFPSTSLIADATIPTVIFPQSQFNLELRIDGTKDKPRNSIWKLKKIIWSLEEHSQFISPACSAHAPRVGGYGKGVLIKETSTVCAGEFKDGWKVDKDCEDGRIEFSGDLRTLMLGAHASDVVEPKIGLSVNHSLVIELVVVEEIPQVNSRATVLTGAARILRMQFKAVVSEMPGLGISWLEEVPPTYENVPISPPPYALDSNDCPDFISPPSFEETVPSLALPAAAVPRQMNGAWDINHIIENAQFETPVMHEVST
ncbi:hypothetical protein CANCADRAFT_31693 [Tortispora caseinolytica NRRL Y-17796]|uniref:LDB19 N-terminal domain-containing protein n=1 Tax=Tortispora caseinolytica NRRL Y-17796 TaxID=767744 RepID=A0A1E4TGL6_9ASCO|nr:hypothetical protein CANCADRAFT_31693 [Tortispora caseinolytica NRRL Y-17796]